MTAPSITTRLPIAVKRQRPQRRKVASRVGFFVPRRHRRRAGRRCSRSTGSCSRRCCRTRPIGQGVGGANGLCPSAPRPAAPTPRTSPQAAGLPHAADQQRDRRAGRRRSITIVVAALAGYALARTPIRGRRRDSRLHPRRGVLPGAGDGRAAVPRPAAASVSSTATGPLIVVLSRLHAADRDLVAANFFIQIPVALEEAAIVDGATRMQTLRKVIIPVAMPAVFTATILSFILAWNDFAFAVSFLQSPDQYTAPLAIVNLGQSQFQTFYNRIDAAVVIITMPIALHRDVRPAAHRVRPHRRRRQVTARLVAGPGSRAGPSWSGRDGSVAAACAPR